MVSKEMIITNINIDEMIEVVEIMKKSEKATSSVADFFISYLIYQETIRKNTNTNIFKNDFNKRVKVLHRNLLLIKNNFNILDTLITTDINLIKEEKKKAPPTAFGGEIKIHLSVLFDANPTIYIYSFTKRKALLLYEK